MSIENLSYRLTLQITFIGVYFMKKFFDVVGIIIGFLIAGLCLFIYIFV